MAPSSRQLIQEAITCLRPGESEADGVAGMVEHGASPRAAIWLMHAAKAHAYLQGRTYVTPHDAKTLAPDVLRHRIALTYEAEAEGLSADAVVARVLDTVLVP